MWERVEWSLGRAHTRIHVTKLYLELDHKFMNECECRCGCYEFGDSQISAEALVNCIWSEIRSS